MTVRSERSFEPLRINKQQKKQAEAQSARHKENRGGNMTNCFDLGSDLVIGLMDLCEGRLTEIKKESGSRVYRVPGFIKMEVTGYFFTNPNVLVLSTDPERINQIINENNIEDSISKIKELISER